MSKRYGVWRDRAGFASRINVGSTANINARISHLAESECAALEMPAARPRATSSRYAVRLRLCEKLASGHRQVCYRWLSSRGENTSAEDKRGPRSMQVHAPPSQSRSSWGEYALSRRRTGGPCGSLLDQRDADAFLREVNAENLEWCGRADGYGFGPATGPTCGRERGSSPCGAFRFIWGPPSHRLG